MSYIIVSSAETDKILYASGNLKEVDDFIEKNKCSFGSYELTIYEIKEVKKVELFILINQTIV